METTDEIINLVNQLVDRKKMFEQELQSKFSNDKKEGIYDVFKWTFPNPSIAKPVNFLILEDKSVD